LGNKATHFQEERLTTTEQLSVSHLPLETVHLLLGAHFEEHDGWRLPASYGDQASEYAAIREGRGGLIDLSSRGRIRVSGSEAVMFLNGLITNDMKTLAENHWMPAAFPNVQGRLIAAVRVVRLRDDQTGRESSPTFLLETEANSHARVLKTIERFTLAGDFRVSDVTEETVQLTVQGKEALDIVSGVVGSAVNEIPRDGLAEIEWRGETVLVVRGTHTAENGFDLILSKAKAPQLWERLVEAGARAVGSSAMETLRIEAGIARYGRDMDETNVITETNLDPAVSYTKGCYIGQEIIARIKYRGHVAKKLSGLVFEGEQPVEPGATIKSAAGKDVGRITSVAHSPTMNRTVALGYVRYEHVAPGTSVRVAIGAAETEATVYELPFVRGSWYES
jgi:folate-binding protein YgfZ